MIFDLSKPLPTRVKFKNRQYALDLSVGNVLKVYDLLKNNELISEDKSAIMLALLVKEKNPPPLLLDYIFREYISITKKMPKNSGMRTIDFKQDGSYIYSSFMHDYGIDLIKERNSLHWWKFVALLQGLSEGTKMREIMKIRSAKIPERNKYNAEYIANLIELKQYYAIDISQEEREQNFQTALSKLAQGLKVRAQSRR